MVLLDVYMWKFRTKIPTEKYFILPGSKWIPFCTNGSEK